MSPRGVREPRRGWWVCMYCGGCVMEMTDGVGGADDDLRVRQPWSGAAVRGQSDRRMTLRLRGR